eukprot:TRINITY_DN545_c0_g1_i1.p1 TRINITY_DN545_c0_g1~~TRINITY_DN545_c0_g1_i1.p1  ORF type:complete len:466 (+),score=100.63 TRINITY_DN545_c0_g1_i1:146-1543(+)
MEGIKHEGKLTKEGGTIKTWKKRHFVLDQGALKYYVPKGKGRGEEKGVITLDKAQVVNGPINYKKKKWCFELQTSYRNFYFVAPSENEMQEWIAALNGVLAAAQEAKAARKKSEAGSTSSTADGAKADKVAKPKVKVNDFESHLLIGKGSFGKVLLVKYLPTGQFYAMKILNKSTIVARGETIHTKAEQKILMKIEHPFLVKLHYSFQTPDKLYFVMDFANGGELFFHLQKEKVFNEDRARFYCAEILLGLEYLHSQGIVYRDLKPENLLLTADGHICMTDFGISKEGLICSDDRTATFCGTPEYLAPEVLKGQTYGKEVDWWSLGTLMYEMLNGLPPFYSDDVQQMYGKIMKAEIKFPRKLSDDAKSLILALLERNPADRMADPEKIKQHPFFTSIDWDGLVKKQVRPPYIPPVRDASDSGQIDPAFTKDKNSLSLTDESSEGTQNPIHFDNFTYVADAPLGRD